jgi:hypothetical protein
MWTKYSVNDFDDDDQRYQIFLDRIDEFNFKNNKDKIKRKKDIYILHLKKYKKSYENLKDVILYIDNNIKIEDEIKLIENKNDEILNIFNDIKNKLYKLMEEQ